MKMINTAYSNQTGGALATRETNVGGSAKIVFAILTGMVSDKIAYPIREISTNAWEAGTFEVHLPTRWNPVFRVRDYGKGLSHRFMMQRFATLGDSTKDGSDNAVGGWGFGGKSPLAYLMRQDGAGSFTVVSRHKGWRRTYVIGLSEKGQIQITCLEESQSDEPSGLDVSFSVRSADVETFQQRASEILWSFEPRPQIFPDPKWPVAEVIAQGEGWTRYASSSVPWSGPQVRMGPVMYPINLNIVTHDGFVEGRDCILFDAAIGTVSVSSSREALAYDEKTKDTLSTLLNRYTDLYVEGIQTEIDKQSTYFDACKVAWQKADALGAARSPRVISRLKWNEVPIRLHVLAPKTSYLRDGWEGFSRYESVPVTTSTAAGATVVVEHRAYRSLDRLIAAGLRGKPVLWVRCSPDDLPAFLTNNRNPAYLLLDKVAIDPLVRASTGPRRKNIRVRRVLTFTKTSTRFIDQREPVDLSEGGLFLVQHARKRRMNTFYDINPGVSIEHSVLRSNIWRMFELNILHEDLKIVIPDPKDDLDDEYWFPLGEFLELKLNDRFDSSKITPRFDFSPSDLPSELRKWPKLKIAPSLVPQDIKDLVDRVQVLIAEIERPQGPNEQDSINDILSAIVGRKELSVKQSTSVKVADEWDVLKTVYPLIGPLTEDLYYAHGSKICAIASNVSHYLTLLNRLEA